MSDLLTHWAVFEDCRRLAGVQSDAVVAPLFRRLIEAEREYARLGAATRGGNKLMPEVLGHARSGWEQYPRADNLEQKVAFVLGCLAHQACDNVMKPLLSEVAGSDWNAAHHAIQDGVAGGDRSYAPHLEVSAYYDTHVFRKVYLGGEAEPFNRFLLARVPDGPGAALEEFVRSLFQRTLLASHTLKPDLEDPNGWLDRVFDSVQQLYVDVGVFVDVFQNPDPEKLKRYRVETDFYREDDPAIRVARGIQTGERVDPDEAEAAVQFGANDSHYGTALELGIAYLSNASAFWRFETDKLSTPNWTSSQHDG